MSKFIAYKVEYVCDQCASREVHVHLVATGSEVPKETPPKDWTTVTVNEVSKDYCPDCYQHAI